MGNIFGFTDDEINVLIGKPLPDNELPLFPHLNIYLTTNKLEIGTRIRKRLPKHYTTKQHTHLSTVIKNSWTIDNQSPYQILNIGINQINTEAYIALHLMLYDPKATNNNQPLFQLDNNPSEKERIITELL